VTVLVDPPNAPGHGRLWSHVASDDSFEELHSFAATLGIPRRGFDRDHYDVPAEWYDRMVAAGATPVSSRELLDRLRRAGLRRPKMWTPVPRRVGAPLLRPPRLRDGDLVAVVQPAGPVDSGRVAAGVEVLRGWGLEVRADGATSGATSGMTLPYLAADDDGRAAELVAAWTDLDVKAVWAARGGYGTQRLLELLDWEVLSSSSPRLLVGFSDLTALHQAVAARLGTATLHAPGVAALADADAGTREHVRRAVMSCTPVELQGTPGGTGTAEGVVVGGNLTLLATSVGTPSAQPARDGIAVLEDVGEAPYRLDRALTQLLRSGWFDGVRGVGLGAFTRCGDPALVRRVLDERLAPLGVPVVHDLPFGHVADNRPVPLGAAATLDAASGSLSVRSCLR
jgi:muramoyltetrapeptide carboxypeptidase